jgi:hypothetical protein
LIIVIVNQSPFRWFVKVVEEACLLVEDAYLVWILVFDDQHDQVGLMNLQVFIL